MLNLGLQKEVKMTSPTRDVRDQFLLMLSVKIHLKKNLAIDDSAHKPPFFIVVWSLGTLM